MAYEAPTAADLKARFPEFTPVADALVDAVLEEAAAAVGDSWLESDRRPATQYLAAHMLAMEGEPQRSNAISAGQTPVNAQAGALTGMKVGDVSMTYSGRSSGAESVGSRMGPAAAEYLKTPYGQRFYELMRKSFPAVRAV
ncbi:MAG: hypothetical protein A49_08550 [Methyloceanibacter sp.]|nr:MAG: hypothetical protein A49_08550 [Methyloceanibacter sp.]